MYIPTHTRASPYFIGMAAGYIKYKMKCSALKIPKVRHKINNAFIYSTVKLWSQYLHNKSLDFIKLIFILFLKVMY